MGLAISYRLAKLMGGNIELDSQEGLGSTFTLVLELNKIPSKASEAVQVVKEESLSFSHHKVLIVEDNAVNQKLAKLILERMNINCDIAANGLEAIDFMRNQTKAKYTMILMDMQMPEMDGVTATKEILKEHGETTPPIIALTANAYDEDKKKCFDAGMVGFLTKPIQLKELKSVLSKY